LSDHIPAAELKKHFAVFGHYYSVDIAPGETIHSRSVLEILSKARTPSDQDNISKRQPDAVFIMMNPGSSQPLVPVNQTILPEDIGRLDVTLVPAKPDTTQYQVMRVMQHAGWQHVRVLNLSDLREAKSPRFISRCRELDRTHGFCAHSVFVPERATERIAKLRRKPHAPLVAAWGVSEHLDPLITTCLFALENEPAVTGLLKPGTADKYFHPLPTLQSQKVEWIHGMRAKLDTSRV